MASSCDDPPSAPFVSDGGRNRPEASSLCNDEFASACIASSSRSRFFSNRGPPSVTHLRMV